MSETKDPREHGCLCQRCRRRYKADLVLPDDLWANIRHGFTLLCGPCITEFIERRGAFDYFQLVKPGQAEQEKKNS